jgi:hypothetical protein
MVVMASVFLDPDARKYRGKELAEEKHFALPFDHNPVESGLRSAFTHR